MQTHVKTRMILAALALVAAFTVVSSHLVTVQAVQHKEWLERAEADYARRIVLPSRRGYIYDRNGEQLAHNFPAFKLIADRYAMEDYNTVASGLAVARGVKHRDITRMFGGRSPANLARMMPEYLNHVAGVLSNHLPGGVETLRASLEFGNRKRLVLAEDLDMDAVKQLKQAFAASGIGGLDFEEGVGRYYPNGSGLCHVIGFVDKQAKGCEGIEYNMNAWLTGQDGYREMMVDRKGRQIPACRDHEVPPRHGSNVTLTIDSGLQLMVEEILAAAEQEFLIGRTAAVLMDPSTGDILALANRPVFDPNTREGERRNFAFSDVYEPGSTFKVVAATAALDLGLVTPDTRIHCGDGYMKEGAVEIRDHHAYGWLTVSGVLAKSSNVGAFKIARMAGIDRYYDYVARFGFGQRTGLGLTAESAGVVRATRNVVDFSRCSYGYAVSVTPVQLAVAYAALANGGMLMRPRIVDKVTDNGGKILWSNPPEARHRVASAKACSDVIKGMREVVDGKGTGKLAEVPGYSVAGKTGTAHLYNPETKAYDSQRPVCSFAGFLPASNPKLVCVIVCSEPRTDKVTRYGGTIAAPIFGRIAARAMDQLGIAPDEPLPEDPKSASIN